MGDSLLIWITCSLLLTLFVPTCLSWSVSYRMRWLTDCRLNSHNFRTTDGWNEFDRLLIDIFCWWNTGSRHVTVVDQAHPTMAPRAPGSFICSGNAGSYRSHIYQDAAFSFWLMRCCHDYCHSICQRFSCCGLSVLDTLKARPFWLLFMKCLEKD